MTDPKVTVLMSVYNGRTYLAQAMESILSQSFSDFEFLVINDGSTEPVQDIFDGFEDGRIRVINQENMGLTRSLNRGLLAARGRYVARMDADDLSLPHRLEAQVKEMDAHPFDLVGCFFDVIDHQGRLIERKEPFIDPIYRLWRLQFHNNYGHGSVMLRKRSVLEVGMYDEGLRYAQDFDLWSRLSKGNNTTIIADVLYRYRLVEKGGQSSVQNYDAQLANAVRISNRSLKACNPLLTEADCTEVRTLYWKFQVDDVSRKGLSLVHDTLEGFCRRYGIDREPQLTLLKRVTRDAIEEIDRSAGLTEQDKSSLRKDFLRVLETRSEA